MSLQMSLITYLLTYLLTYLDVYNIDTAIFDIDNVDIVLKSKKIDIDPPLVQHCISDYFLDTWCKRPVTWM